MKYLIMLFCLFATFSCDNPKTMNGEYVSYGKEISTDAVLTQNEMMDKFKNLQPGDTLEVKFASKIKEVCQMEGCWVKMELDPTTESMVKFKKHEFTVPKDSDGKEAIVAGKAYIKEATVADQKHLAMDAGSSEKEIAAILEPELTYEFMADGILIK